MSPAAPEPEDRPTVVPPAAAAEPATIAPGPAPAMAATMDPGPPPDDRAPVDAPAPPGYELLGELGRGGMGVVYKARQTALNRVVALKMILAGGHAGEELRRRFLAEAQAVARLRHPNIVQVHDLGEHGGNPYFALEFVAGGSLDKKLAGTPLPPRAAAELVATLAEAMQHAHDQGIVHRDLKPANVLVEGAERQPNPPDPPSLRGKGGDQIGNVAEIPTTFPVRTPPFPRREGGPGGLGLTRPKVMDFGLAKMLDTDSGQTRTGAIMGTPSYMAPEQAQGRKDVGPAANVYALGAILYECLTGRPPFKAATPLDTVLQVIEADPVPPTQLQPRTPRDLETVALKCLAKAPGRRYGSARALANDLRRYLAGEPIQARPASVLERSGKWVRRNRAVTAAAAGTAAALLLGLGLALWQAERAREAEQTAEGRATALASAKKAAEKQLARAEGLLYFSRLSDVERFLAEGRPDVAWDRLTECNWSLRGWEFNRLWTQFHRVGLPFRGHTRAVVAVAFSPDGGRLATASADNTARLWDAHLHPGALVLKGTRSPVVALAFNDDGTLLLARDEQGKLYAWDRTTGYPLDETEPLPANATAEAATPDGKYRLFVLGGQPYYAETARWQQHLKEEAARWAEQSRPRLDWHRDQASKAEAAGQWFAAAFHRRQLARPRADQGDAAAAVEHAQRADALSSRHAIARDLPRPAAPVPPP